MPRYDDDRDVPPRRRGNPTLIILLVLAGVLVLGGCLVVGAFAVLWSRVESDQRRPAGAEGQVRATLPEPRETPVMDVTKNSSDIINAFGDNLIAAEKTWVGKRLRQKGLYRQVRKDDGNGPRHGRFYATFYNGHESVYIARDEERAFAGLRDGALITFEADLVGYEQDVPDVAYGIWLIYDNAKLVGPDDVSDAKRVEGDKVGAAKAGNGLRRLYTPDEFRQFVIGKTPAEVIAAVGKPDETRERVPEKAKVTRPGGADTGERVTFYYDWWEFHNRVINPVTEKPYRVIRVRFNGGRADRIESP